MSKKISIIIAIWLVYIFSDYFLLWYFIKPLAWLLFCLILLILLIIQIIELVRLREGLKTNQIINISVLAILFVLTFYNFSIIPRSIIESIDWTISYNKRKQIVYEVLSGNLKPNTSMNNGICELPFDFPIISNGGNDIYIEDLGIFENTKTIKFWISRGLFSSSQIYFIYTNDNGAKNYYQKLIITNPEDNWQLEENWFRIMDRE